MAASVPVTGDGSEGPRDERLLNACLRWPTDVELLGRLISDAGINADRFLALVRRHRVSSLVAAAFSAVRTHGVVLTGEAATIERHLQRKARRLAIANLAQVAEAVRIDSILNNVGIDHLHLKGASLSSRIFANPLLRDGRDIDVLVPPEFGAKADTALTEAGFKRVKPRPELGRRFDRLYLRYSHERVYGAPSDITVEVKIRLVPTDKLLPLTFDALTRRAVTIEVAGSHLKMLGDDDLMLHLVAHGARHCWFRLKWLVDIAALLALDGPPGANRLIDLADKIGLAVAALEAVYLSNTLFGVPVSTTLLERVARDRDVRRRLPMIQKAMASDYPGHDLLATGRMLYLLGKAEFLLKPDFSYRASIAERLLVGGLYSVCSNVWHHKSDAL